MILNETLLISITNRNVSKYIALGYSVKSGDTIRIHYSEAYGKRKLFMKCDDCGEFYSVCIGRLNETNIKYCHKHRWEEYSSKKAKLAATPLGKKSYQSRGGAISVNRKGKGLKPSEHWDVKKSFDEYKGAVSRAQRKWSTQISELDNSELRGRNGTVGAYQLDHIVSQRYGFDNAIPPYIIGHICNLKFITWESNNSKGDTCGMVYKRINTISGETQWN